jgi:hypothetical protein
MLQSVPRRRVIAITSATSPHGMRSLGAILECHRRAADGVPRLGADRHAERVGQVGRPAQPGAQVFFRLNLSYLSFRELLAHS